MINILQISLLSLTLALRVKTLTLSSADGLTFVLPLFYGSTHYEVHYADSAKTSQMTERALYSLCVTQHNHDVVTLIPRDQELYFGNLSNTRNSANFVTSNYDQNSCWVRNRITMLLEFMTAKSDMENLLFIESDQLFFKSMWHLRTLCKGTDIGFTFTNNLPKGHKKHLACLNSGIIYVRKVNEVVIDFFKSLLHNLDSFIESNGCGGGYEQNVMCSLIGGYVKVGEIRHKDELRICSVPRDSYNPKRVGCAPKGTMKKAYLSHFVGQRKYKILEVNCMLEYKRHFGGKRTRFCS